MTLAFVEQLSRYQDRLALADDNDCYTYAELAQAVSEKADYLQHLIALERPLVALVMDNSIDSIISYLACHHINAVILLINPSLTDELKSELYRDFNPNIIISPSGISNIHQHAHQLAPQLCLLMSTSGSTGAGKCVALSYTNLSANTDAIVGYLPMRKDDAVLATLPFTYSYGLSILHTHLAIGAQVVLTNSTVFDKAFWNRITQFPITTLAGVPSFWEMLVRLRFTQMELPALRYITQAGGKLAESVVKTLASYADQQNVSFYVMYGQTEATARIAYVEPATLINKPHVIGKAIPGGSLTLRDGNNQLITETDTQGELFYAGPNVMLGYVTGADQLAVFNPSQWLATGDLACRDADGDFYITGRKKRMIKVFGERVNLDAIEHQLQQAGFDVRTAGRDNLLAIFCLPDSKQAVQEHCKAHISLNHSAIRVMTMSAWPLLENGKVNYQSLNDIL